MGDMDSDDEFAQHIGGFGLREIDSEQDLYDLRCFVFYELNKTDGYETVVDMEDEENREFRLRRFISLKGT